jgi:hypothetical protein
MCRALLDDGSLCDKPVLKYGLCRDHYSEMVADIKRNPLLPENDFIDNWIKEINDVDT